MKTNVRLIALLAFVAAAALCWRSLRKDTPAEQDPSLGDAKSTESHSHSTRQFQTEDRPSEQRLLPADASIISKPDTVSNREASMLSFYDHHISFYGRVVDENGRPIPNANVRFGVAEKPWESTVKHERVTDSNGCVQFTGVRGASLSIKASKEGYYTPERGSITITYDDRLRKAVSLPIPTADAPAILVLKRKGTAETLVHLATRPAPVSKDGTPLEINLAALGMPPNILRIELWVFNHATNAAGHYDWRCSLSIPGGGFLERPGRFDFEAPADGYQEFFEFPVFANTLAWRVSLQKEFFVRFSDNRFGRVSFHLDTLPGRESVTIESFLNPTPGSRNLEDDPAKLIEVPGPYQSAR